MIVYADILIILNLAVDYFLLRAAAFLQHLNPPLWRMLLSSLVGGISSLYIFLPPQGAVLDILFRTAVCAAMTFICFGFGKIKRFLRSFGVFLLVTFGYGGAMFQYFACRSYFFVCCGVFPAAPAVAHLFGHLKAG